MGMLGSEALVLKLYPQRNSKRQARSMPISRFALDTTPGEIAVADRGTSTSLSTAL